MKTKSLTRISKCFMGIRNLRAFVPLRGICLSLLFFATSLHAQTTLSGDHVITGDLSVGTSGTTGNVVVTGETGGSAGPALAVTGDGGVVFSGSAGVGQIPATGAGARMMWYPKKAAFRAGLAADTEWNDGNIGNYSIALGWWSLSSGENATALSAGFAQGANAVAMNAGYAEGVNSTAMNTGHAEGSNSMAVSGGWAGGLSSIAMSGGGAEGDYSAAMNWGLAEGDYSIAMSGGHAGGSYSAAMNSGYAAGEYSMAIGAFTVAGSYSGVAIGRGNVGGGNAIVWEEEDPIFEVGIGTGDTEDPLEIQKRNALTILKSGDIIIPKRQGDILMGEFGNPE